MIINHACDIIIDSSDKFDQKQKQAVCDRELVSRKPLAHDNLLHNCGHITDSKDNPADNQ